MASLDPLARPPPEKSATPPPIKSVPEGDHAIDIQRMRGIKPAEEGGTLPRAHIAAPHETADLSPITHREIGIPAKLPRGELSTILDRIDDKLLGFINGDQFLAETGLEGGDPVANMQKLLPYLEQTAPLEKPEKLIHLIKDCIQNARSLPEERAEKVKSLEVGQKMLLPGGWRSRGGGHAILYLIEKTGDRQYAFTAVNTGSGIELFHEAKEVGAKEKYKPILRLKEIDEEQMADPEFFKALGELEIVDRKDGVPWDHGPPDIYQRILPSLQGKRDLAFEAGVDFISAQRSGTCSWESLLKLIRLEADSPKAYKKFVFDLQKDSLEAYFNKIQSGAIPLTDERMRLFKLCAEARIRSSLKQRQAGVISPEEMRAFKEKIEEMLQAVQSVWKGVIRLEAIPPPISYDNNYPFATKVPKLLTPMEIIRTPQEAAASLNLRVSPLQELAPSLSLFNQNVSQIVKACRENQIYSRPDATIEEVTHFLEAVSATKFETGGYWEKICQNQPAQEVEKAMGQIMEMQQLLFAAISQIPIERRDSPDHMAMMNILLAINFKLSTASSIEDQRHSCWMGMPTLRCFSSSFLTLRNPGMRALLNETLAFEKQQKKEWHDTFERNAMVLHFRNGELKEDLGFHKNLYSFEGMLKTLYKDPKFREKIDQLYPQLSGADDKATTEAILPLATDFESDLFPKPFKLLYQQDLLCWYFVNNPKLALVKVGASAPVIKISHSYASESESSFQLRFPGVDNYFNIDWEKNPLPFQTEGFEKIDRELRRKRFGQNEDFKPDASGIYWGSQESNRAVTLPAQGGLNGHETHEIAYILSNKAMQIPNLLSFFERYPEKFFNRDFQLFFYLALFSQGVIEKSLKDNPLLVSKVSQFLESQLKLQKGLGNMQEQLFFLWMLREFSKVIPEAKSPRNISKEIRSLIQGLPETSIQGERLKSLSSLHLIASYHGKELSQIPKDELIALTTACAYIRIHPFDKQLSHPYLELDMREAMGEVAKAALASSLEVQKEIKKNIAKEVLKSEGDFKIDLSTFSLYQGEALLGPLPTTMVENRHFQELFKDKKISLPSLLSPGVHQFNSEGERYVIYYAQNQINGETELVIQRVVEGEYQTYLPPEKLAPFFQPKALLNHHQHWMGEDVFGENATLHIEESGRRVAEVELVKEKEGYRIGSFKKIDDNTQLQDLYTLETPFSAFGEFQPLASTLLWSDKTLEFTQLGIQFNIDEQKRAHYSKDPSFTLATIQRAPTSLPFFRGSLLLEGKKTERFLFPREPIDIGKMGSGALKRTVPLEHSQKEGRFFEIEEKEGALLPKNGEETLYLAYLHLAHKKYKKAYALLDQTRAGNPRGYSENEKEVLEWITELMKRSGDQSPQAKAVALQVLYLQVRNAGYKKEEKGELCQRISQALTDYYPIKQHVQTTPLTPAQEVELLAFSGGPSQRQKRDISKAAAPLDLQKLWGTIAKIGEQKLKVSEYLYGEELLVKSLDQFFKAICSDPIEGQKKAFAALALLKMPEESPLAALRSAMQDFALYATPEQRNELREEQNRRPTILPLYSFCNMKIGLNAPSQPPPKPKKEELKEKKTEVTPIPRLETSRTFSSLSFPSLVGSLTESVRPKTVKEGLIEALQPPEGSSKVISLEFKRVQTSVQEDSRTEVRSYALNEAEMGRIVQDLENKIETLDAEKEKLKTELLALVNQEPSDPEEAVKFRLQILGKSSRDVTLDDLVIFYLQNNGEALQKRNPYLSQETIHAICDKLTNYLLSSSEKDYLARLKGLIDQASSETGEVKEKILEDLQAAFREKRSYDPQKEKVLLIYEYYSGMRLRANQVENLRQMAPANRAERRNLITQLIMGSGKSKVILPLLAYLNSHGDNVPVLIVPPQVYATNLEDMRSTSGSLLQQRAETIELKEGEPLSLDICKAIVQTLKKVKEEKSYLLMSAPQMHKLRLHFIEVCKELGEVSTPSAELVEKYELLKRIRNELSDAIIDEVDLVLDCLKEVNFSSGQWVAVSVETRGTLLNIFNAIENSAVLKDFFKLSQETEAPFDRKSYEEKIKPLLANEIMRLASCESPEIKAYLLGLQKAPDGIRNNPVLRNPLALGKELLNSLFPLVLQKNSNEHFGLSKEKPSYQAIPYSRTNTPSEGSEFGSPYETLLYTMLYFTRNGLEPAQMRDLIDQYKAKALQQHKSEGVPLLETESYQNFQKLKLVPGKDLFTIQKDEIEGAVRSFNSDPERKMQFVHDFAWNKIGSYSERLTSNPQHLVGMFQSVQGFTGTLWNQSTFHHSLVPLPDTAIDGRTLSVLDRIDPKIVPFSSPEQLLEKSGRYDALIDLGASFRGWDASKVALEMLKRHAHIDGVTYVNDRDAPPGSKGQLVILERGEAVPKLLSASQTPMGKRFSYYNVIEGIDLTQHATAKALMTFSKTSPLRGLQQGAWRMRGLERKQKIDFAIPGELEDTIKEARHAFNLSIENQAERQQADNLPALKQKISARFEYLAEQLMCHKETTPQEVQGLMRDCRHLFVHKTGGEPWELFGEQQQLVPTKELMERYIADKLQQFQKIYEKYPVLQVTPLKEIANQCRAMINYDLLPETALQTKSEGYGRETEIKQETKAEQKTETKLQLDVVQEKEGIELEATPISTLREEFKKHGWLADEVWKPIAANQVLSDCRQQLAGFDATVPLFSPRLQMTQNFLSISKNKMAPSQILFQTGTKPATLCALKIDESGNKSLLLLHPNEAEFLGCMLDSDRDFEEGNLGDFTPSQAQQLFGKGRKGSVLLISPELGILKAGKDSLDDETLKKDPQYIALIAQAKFYNGDLNTYSKEEQQLLRKWVAEVGADHLLALLGRILCMRPDDQQAYEGSQLQKILTI